MRVGCRRAGRRTRVRDVLGACGGLGTRALRTAKAVGSWVALPALTAAGTTGLAARGVIRSAVQTTYHQHRQDQAEGRESGSSQVGHTIPLILTFRHGGAVHVQGTVTPPGTP